MGSYPALLWLATGFALVGSFMFGLQIAVLNTSLDYVAEDMGFDTETYGALVSSAILLGALGGALGAGTLADAVGPKTATICSALPLALGSALAAAAAGETALICGRVLAGVGVGAASLLVPRYITEIAPTPIRGLLATLNQVFINVGIVAAYALGYPYEGGAFSVRIAGRDVAWWRVMLAAGVLPAALQAAGMALWCPESPAWLLWRGWGAEAARGARRLQGSAEAEGGGGGEDAEQPLLGGAEGAAAAEQGREGFRGLLAPQYRRVLLLAAALPMLQQLSGINTVILYGTEVFKSAGVKSPVTANLILGSLNLVATVGAAALMDRAGRKALLTWSFAGMSGCLAAMAAFLLLPTPERLAGPVAFAAMLAYIAAFALGCGPVPWVYLPEILPPAIKGPAQSGGTAVSWVGNLAVGLTFPAMLAALGPGGSYAVYAAFCGAAALFCRRFMVETMRQPLAQVHARLMGLAE